MPSPSTVTPPEWSRSKLPVPALIGLCTFGILMLELSIIRWSSSQIRIFAYFNNLVLIGAFLGMGLGVALGKRRPELFSLTLPLLLLLSAALGFSDELGLANMRFPDSSIALWGGEVLPANRLFFVLNMGIVVSLFGLIIVVFACAAVPLGHLFSRLEVLKAYSSDLLGSLLGVLCFSLLAFFSTGPSWWLALSLLPFVILQHRQALQLACALAIILVARHSQQEVIYSPYNRIVLREQPGLSTELQVNRDFHQFMHDLSDENIARKDRTEQQSEYLAIMRRTYDLPFIINRHRDTALIVGAGTGNDVQAALRNQYQSIDSIDIDGRIIGIGKALHPEQPYSNPKTHPIVEDARAFFEQNQTRRYDVVCYGLLDSHAMSSAMSTLRLDNYVYTQEGIASAWKLVAPKGHLTLSISCYSGQWFIDRLYWTLFKATGQVPLCIFVKAHSAVTFIVPRDQSDMLMFKLNGMEAFDHKAPIENVRTPSDDWPFLYTRPNVFPWGYAIIIGFTLLLAALSTRTVFGIGKDGSSFHWPLFLMGAAFMLIEARGVTSMSLLFGSTWAVNAAIFTGILTMVLLANLVVMKIDASNPLPWFAGLFLATLLLWAIPVGALNAYSLPVRGLLGGLITGLPIGFAGLIVPILLKRSANPTAALGSNLLGSVLGGCLEYYSMLGGMRTTALLALCLYLTAFLLLRRQTYKASTQSV